MVYLDKERLAHYQGWRRTDARDHDGEFTRIARVSDGRREERRLQSRPRVRRRRREDRGRHARSAHGQVPASMPNTMSPMPKCILNGGQPQLVDSVKGTTQGRQIDVFFELRQAVRRRRARSAGEKPYIEEEVVLSHGQFFRPASYPRLIEAAGLWTMSRSRVQQGQVVGLLGSEWRRQNHFVLHDRWA